MADQQYSQYPAGIAGFSNGSYTGDSSYSQSGYGSANTGAYTIENPDDYPDLYGFLWSQVAMEDQENEETQSATEDVPALAEIVASEVGVQEPPSHTAAAAAESKPIRAGLEDDGQIENPDNDSDYHGFLWSQVAMEDQENEETQPATEDVPALAEIVASEVGVQEPHSHTAAAAAESKPIQASRGRLEDDGQNCTICFEPWTSSSEHRLVSLRCGHLFGRSCISRWLQGENARCPQCNARARKAEIINIYTKSLKVLDTSERDKAECERLRKELMCVQEQLQKYRVFVQHVPPAVLGLKLLYCKNCGAKHAAVIVTICFECGTPRFS